jgi:hypothetical protein
LGVLVEFRGLLGFRVFGEAGVRVVADCAGDGFEEVADALLSGDFDAEVAGFIEEFGEVGAHVRDKSADDLVGGDTGFAYALADVLLDAVAIENLVGGLVEPGGRVACRSCGASAVASIANELIGEALLTVGELRLAGGWVDSSFRHRDLL